MASQPYIGAIFLFAGNFAPRGFMLCQGQLLPISQYAALFSILGTTYGGNGTTNFALPDLQGRAAVGVGNGAGLGTVVLGEKAGAQTVSVLTSNMPSHNHLINVDGAASGNNTPAAHILGTVGVGAADKVYSANNPTTTMAANAVSMTGSNVPLNVQNPFLGLTYIIATVGIFPSRN